MGGIRPVGVYDLRLEAPGHPKSNTLPKNLPWNMTMAFEKGFSFHIGSVDPRPLAPYLLELIASVKAKPSYTVDA